MESQPLELSAYQRENAGELTFGYADLTTVGRWIESDTWLEIEQ